ncbi:5-guanidino-2-oxopentanoate decarboxylase [Egicoccus sp. AB-alg2]|uniref:5-guanidino-2-oxopentanoate decarboxylase n=1 Tax=Egicoccus sp. AB-alg2 TaxID=3242693 RepID=UPI00359E1D70
MTTMTGGEAVVRALAAHGVDTAFGIPGTHNLAIYAHLSAYGIRHVSPRHEQGAGYAADGYARVAGRPGVAITTTGPAALNAAAAAAQSFSDSVPVLHVSPGLPLGHPGRGNGYLHEVKDQTRAMDAVTAYSHRVTAVAEIPGAVAEAFASMTAGRPRPVHLEVPLDLLETSGTVTDVEPVEIARSAAPPARIGDAARFLAPSQRPVVIVGGGARHAATHVRALAERLGAVVVATTNGKGTFDEAHPLSVGAGLHHPTIAALVEDADAVVAVGTELAPSDLWNGPLPLDGRLVRIDVDPGQVLRNARPHVGLVGDAAATLEALTAALAPAPDPSTAETRAARWRNRLHEDARVEGAAWVGLIEILARFLPADSVVAGDSAMVCYYGALTNLPRHRPASFLYPTGLGTLGYGLPAAIGAKLARPQADVLALLGDGGLMFTVAELAAAAQVGLPLAVVVVDNRGYGEIRREMLERDERPLGTELPTVDFPAVARGFGCHAHRITDLADLPQLLEAAFCTDRPTLLHVDEALAGAPATGR